MQFHTLILFPQYFLSGRPHVDRKKSVLKLIPGVHRSLEQREENWERSTMGLQ